MAFGRVINRPQFEVVFTPDELKYIINAIDARTARQDKEDGLEEFDADRLYSQLTDLMNEVDF